MVGKPAATCLAKLLHICAKVRALYYKVWELKGV